MADDKPWSVAFAGSGDTSEANIKELLDDWLPEKLEHLTVPGRIGRRDKGLKVVRAWLADEVGEDSLSEVPVGELDAVLAKHRADGAEVYLVYIPAEEWDEASEEAGLVRKCVEFGIPVKDLTAGLDDFVPPEVAAAEPEEAKPTRQRGKPRNPTTEELVDEAEKAAAPEAPAAAEPVVTVNLSSATVQALLAFAGSLAQDVKASVQAELPGAPAPKTYPYYVDDDGNYRPRVGRGRPKAGEQKVDLTVEEIVQLRLELPE